MEFNAISGQHFFHKLNSSSQDFGMDNINPEPRLFSWQVQHQFRQQIQLQQPIQRFINEPERTFFSATHLSNQPQGLNCVDSPSPSQGALTSTCSSVLSPRAQNDWSQDSLLSHQILDNYSFTQAISQFGHGNLWFGPFDQFSQIQAFSNMSPEGVTYEGDEGYDEMTIKTEYAMETDNRILKTEGGCFSYPYPSDEGLGASIQDEESPRCIEHDTMSNADRDTKSDIDQAVLVAEEVSDTEYIPKSTCTHKRAASKATSHPAKRPRTIKDISKVKDQFTCKSCDHAPFNDAEALQRHTASAHTRAFTCVFAFAGCTSTFASKNEWKRHTSSQHLNLSAWVCELQACGKVQNQNKNGPAIVKSSEFNRKDLFTQHLRRIHAPLAVKRMQKKNQEWEDRLKELQTSCLRVKRPPPTKLSCPLRNCDVLFEGASCWDDRMEHVGKHLEQAAACTGANKLEVRQENDEFLVSWALREGIIEGRPGGSGYRLCVKGSQSRVEEE